MTPRKLRVPEEVRALIRHMHPRLKKKVRAALAVVLINPDHGKALREELLGLRSVRVGRLRIIYRVAPGAIEVVAVGPRQTIYEETLRLLRRDAQEERGQDD
ncbi:MAG: type II toxin-antitoxin system RelE/ParE family toxin [candidate division NC10 bacterium]|nr:type II toxin-antitoxin system RelE/ParE family toxin [candidate division NC10 bacterium]